MTDPQVEINHVSACGIFRPRAGRGCYCGQCRQGEGCRIAPRQIELCREWIRTHVEPRKTINSRAHSYALKHRVEDWARTLPAPDRGAYIPNGAFIVAALLEGYRTEPTGINAVFAMSFAPMVRRQREARRAQRQRERERHRLWRLNSKAELRAINDAYAGRFRGEA